ncbi:MAG: hypothetical protein ABJM29_18940 [Rhizobiaceae bacterium]
MSDEIFYSSLTVVAIVVLAVCIYIIRGKRAQKRNPNAYHWKPEQDYDVVMQGETPMTPGFPVLKKRERKNRRHHKDD